jgi:hypothetical protein
VIAEKFQALIRTGTVARTLERRDMGERAGEQNVIAEAIADAIFQDGSAAPASPRFFSAVTVRLRRLRGVGRARLLLLRRSRGFCFAAAAHRTSVNIRLQRTAHGQFQISQACAPPPIEKKMICALPIRFSNGT